MTSKEIRQAFLDFFQSKEHLIVASAPLVAKDDPTLMFNNSGMAQFKDFFLGNGTPPSKRIADTQKCLRVSGKHNDLEDVGLDTYHHTLFEMLGNWSFGDYFKKEALAWSWELLTEVYKLPKDRLYVSVFGGDEKDGVPFDQEAFDLWKAILGGEERIILGNKKDNFWEMGEVGPCGPCSEIHIDLRDPHEVAQTPGKDLVNNDHPQVVEIWNNVFMQFERRADGSLLPLPARHVDTGMGFERLCMAIQGKKSNYDTDVFSGMITSLANASKTVYGENQATDVALRVCADHIRAIAFAIADGLVPSNNKAGYVIRRILRRAVRYGYTYLGFKEPFLHRLVALLCEQFDGVFPELKAQENFVTKVIFEEETAFLRTLDKGLTLLDKLISEEKGKMLNGRAVFELYDTFGFPVDLTALIAREKGYTIDGGGYQIALDEQKARSRKDATKEAADWTELIDNEGFNFVGYDLDACQAEIIKYRKVNTKGGVEYHIVLDTTPFYAEMGGQVGDTGTLTAGGITITIDDTKKENDLFIHISRDKNVPAFLAKQPSPVSAQIDTLRRQKIRANHTATHLMLAAMRQVLGGHISQKGSFQNEDITRFDFAHFAKVTPEELAQIEGIVNQKIRENISLQTLVDVPIAEAIDRGATATFGEKYGDFVRVVIFDETFSVELCGGTHIAATGGIGLFMFVSESSVSAGVRRVEALTGEKAMAAISAQIQQLDSARNLLKTNDVTKGIQALLDERSILAKRLETLENEKIGVIKQQLLQNIIQHNNANGIFARVEVPHPDALKTLCYQLKDQLDELFCFLVADIDAKPHLALYISESLVGSRSLNASVLIRDLAKEVRGGGGGQPFFATAGGSDISGLERVLERGKSIFIS